MTKLGTSTYKNLDLPFVSIIMPIRNEAAFIEQSLGAAIAQDYPTQQMEILIADGMSTDGTREIIKSIQFIHPNILIIDNPKRIVPTGLNAAINQARGEIIVRMDAHCEYPSDYIRKLVSLLRETEAQNVGGVLVAVGPTSYAQAAIRAAYYSPVSVGGALRSYDTANFRRDVDAVHGGCWRKDTLLSVGLFDENLVRNQDDELSFRLRENGGRIVQDSAIQVKYHVRDSLAKLMKQFIQYGYWKVLVIRKHPRQASLRHFIPGIFLLSLAALVVLAVRNTLALCGLGGIVCIYLGAIFISGFVEATRLRKWCLWPGIILALIAMHVGYGAGFLIGILRSVFGNLPTVPFFSEITR